MPHRSSRVRTAVALLALAVLVLGVAPSGGPEACAAGPTTFTYLDAVGFDNLDPALAISPSEQRLTMACFEPLTGIDPNTGKIVPAAAASWTTSPDGRTWTFKLRPAKWMHWKRDSKEWEEVAAVTAQDFVGSWKRLLDPQLKRDKRTSPNATLLDPIPGCHAVRIDGARATALDSIRADLLSAASEGKTSLKGEDVVSFLDEDQGENPSRRAWCSTCSAAEVQRLLGWNAKDPLVPAKLKEIAKALDAEAKAARTSYEEAVSHVGTDRGFYAKGADTLVVETAGPSPWLPSLMAQGPLGPVHVEMIERQRQLGFQNYFFEGNGAYVMTGELPPAKRESMAPPPFKVVLTKSPKYWNAGAVPADTITCLVNYELDDIATQYRGDASWVTYEAFRDSRSIFLDARKPGWTCPPTNKAALTLPSLMKDVYDVDSGSVLLVWFRCQPPFDKPDVRKALASLVDREPLQKLAAIASGKAPPLASRIVPPRTTGVSGDLRPPTFDRSKAKAMYGGKKLATSAGNNWLSFVFRGDDAAVGDALIKQWGSLGKADVDEVIADTASTEDIPKKLAEGAWHIAMAPVRPGYDDPLAVLSTFSIDGTSQARYADARFEALLRAARDVPGWAAAPLDKNLSDLADVQSSAKAGASPDAIETARRRLLVEAEKRLLDEAVVIPLWTTFESGIVKPSVQGLTGLASWRGSARSVVDVHPLVGVTPGT